MTGDRLLWLAEHLCGAETRRNVFEPLVADWQREYRDARGRGPRARILVCGGVALLVALAICVNPFRGAEGAPARRFLGTVFAFALAATIIQTAPFQSFAWWRYPFRWDVLFYSPQYVATGVALALLPAAMRAARRIAVPRLAVSIGVAVAMALVARDVIAPASARVFHALRRAELIASVTPNARQHGIARQQQTEARELEARQRGATGTWAQIARIERHQRGALALMAIAFALLGLAIGRARSSTPALSAATAWWFFAWIGYQLLQFLANRLQIVAPAPIDVAIWLPPLAVLTVAIIALISAAKAPPPRMDSWA